MREVGGGGGRDEEGISVELPCDCKVSAGAEWLRVNLQVVVLCLPCAACVTHVTSRHALIMASLSLHNRCV